ncbi:hypothetical protein ATO6_08470 [Oceanicola sp. 22II-s10i]|uniref:alpha-hydroxy acid oxidase n=1 Tax=Oceanicola sp. 22II-s10i TaxID=1317116 RepID=UPI000B521959|nr:alpha-hydroxy acid oxidase [Oceanicola sp. 22II-s10i]OWU85078.1 hypothetical protein ATO6_08470 [Oceanicola sp. 22II-s10i]
MTRPPDALNIHELREIARRRLPRWLFEFVDRGTEDEVALRNNRAAFERLKLDTQVLVDVSARDLSTEVLGQRHRLPIGIAPTGAAGLLWYKGELELARAAKAAGIPFTLATGSLTSMEEIARDVGGTLWFQLYIWSDLALSLKLVERAKNAGFEALVVTVDGPVPTNREYNVRNGFELPFRYTRRNTAQVLLHPRWFAGVLMRYVRDGGLPTRANYPEGETESITRPTTTSRVRKNDSVSWEDLKRLREMWPGKLMLKGVLTATDAERALEAGCDAVIVSNHGGRNFDSSMAPITVLPEIVDAVGSRTTVIVDSAFRRGSDIVKGLALGADMVLVGRPTLWGITAGGEAGARHAIGILEAEMSRTISYLGCTSVDQLARHMVRTVDTPHLPSRM